jgi:hypothetical protein
LQLGPGKIVPLFNSAFEVAHIEHMGLHLIVIVKPDIEVFPEIMSAPFPLKECSDRDLTKDARQLIDIRGRFKLRVLSEIFLTDLCAPFFPWCRAH